MRTLRTLMTVVLAGAGLFGMAGTAVADSPSPGASSSSRRGCGVRRSDRGGYLLPYGDRHQAGSAGHGGRVHR